MIKQTLYPKTQRIGNDKIQITEKLDGSNLGFFKHENALYIALRNNIIAFQEIDEAKDILYKGLYGWLLEHGNELEESLNEGSCIFGEWIGMGKIHYPHLDKKFYMFAKANVSKKTSDNLEYKFVIYNLIYDIDLFGWSFTKNISHCIGSVPLLGNLDFMPTVDYLNELYELYAKGLKRNVEGFVVSYYETVRKYVRMKNGKLEKHTI